MTNLSRRKILQNFLTATFSLSALGLPRFTHAEEDPMAGFDRMEQEAFSDFEDMVKESFAELEQMTRKGFLAAEKKYQRNGEKMRPSCHPQTSGWGIMKIK